MPSRAFLSRSMTAAIFSRALVIGSSMTDPSRRVMTLTALSRMMSVRVSTISATLHSFSRKAESIEPGTKNPQRPSEPPASNSWFSLFWMVFAKVKIFSDNLANGNGHLDSCLVSSGVYWYVAPFAPGLAVGGSGAV